MNLVALTGRLTRHPEIKQFTKGEETMFVVNTTLAIPGRRSDEGGYVRITAYQELAMRLHRYCKQGYLISIHGFLRQRKYNNNGHWGSVTEVVVQDLTFLSKPLRKGQSIDEDVESAYPAEEENELDRALSGAEEDTSEHPFCKSGGDHGSKS
ncbi:MAG: single-stranded DNA-binding protein [Candidatus Babeliaceae bacterium]|nr:single-stranded DNA-binding protein [Candidatus Babeliaceae bacterium]